MWRVRVFASSVIALVLFAACSGGSGGPATPAATVGGDIDVVIAAKDTAFDRSQLTLPAGRPTKLVFDNQEAVPHNVAIQGGDGQTLFEGEIFNGPAERTYDIPALDAGTYKFICTVHPNMIGELTVR
jgi:plastocyanin